MAGLKPGTTCFMQAIDNGLVFNSFEDNSGGWGYKANFAFDGYDPDNTNCFLTNATWNVSQSNAPYLQIAPADSPSSPLTGLTAKVIASERVASDYQGNVEIYPLPAGSYVASWIYDGGLSTETISFSVGNLNKKAKELSSGTLASSISASTSTLSVYVGEGTTAEIMGVWPNTPFYASIMPATPSAGVPNNLDSEIVRVSGVSTDGNGNTTLSVVRAQKGTTAKAFSEGAIVTNASYASDALILGDDGTVEPEEPWIGTDDIKNEAITSEKIAESVLRVNRMLIPAGTVITANADLNTIDYLSVGKYYCQGNSTVATLSNCPTTNAFMMEVFSPIATTIDDETTAGWCYRLRLITDYTGKMYIQRANTQGTAGVFTYFDWVAVNPDASVSSYSVTSQASHSSGTNSYALKKQFNCVTFAANIAWVNSITADTWTLLGVIPSDVRPSTAHYCSGVAVKSNGSLLGYCRVEIETNGNVSFKCSAANAGLSGVGFNLSWFV